MHAFKNHTTIVEPAKPMPVHQVIASLARELRAASEILNTLHHYSPMASVLNAMADLQERGVIDQELLRQAERNAVLSQANHWLAKGGAA